VVRLLPLLSQPGRAALAGWKRATANNDCSDGRPRRNPGTPVGSTGSGFAGKEIPGARKAKSRGVKEMKERRRAFFDAGHLRTRVTTSALNGLSGVAVKSSPSSMGRCRKGCRARTKCGRPARYEVLANGLQRAAEDFGDAAGLLPEA